MKPLIATFLLLCCGFVQAQDFPAGVYGHEYTAQAGEPVWNIRKVGDGLALSGNAGTAPVLLHSLSAEERAVFWQKMGWPAAGSAAAQCASNGDDLFCQVPKRVRAGIAWLKDNESDFFYYSEIGGVMEISRLPPR
ncbi:hypothetical protein KIF53_12045 [Chromobacterium subtsugae]|uniref:Uncharacterized protein n=1 Tax=Chromobacterium subtsugae TaxID=251747 RepID=A0ABS7FE62_9NEIS|nr:MULTISPECIES: hypothetical protein [Chromobacterium]KUM03820.1 hypothetical protein Cv017_17355 [Chromobacterium subtsugae]KZE87519.1 hypothetical protein AWB61_11655 [Chromobacterium sp. F49]MBW7566672.1 hypothetical protein [Chromobacterium subtsugae]MBW8288359.1 hypothetical protein [Chromobacterium subtsugae]WSE92252.1 hypothetical protein U6115_03110 [Chromobacterium subtsugae]